MKTSTVVLAAGVAVLVVPVPGRLVLGSVLLTAGLLARLAGA